MNSQGIFFRKPQLALITHKIFFITNKINYFITKSFSNFFWKTFSSFGAFRFFCMSRNLFFYLHQLKVNCYHCYLMLYSKLLCKILKWYRMYFSWAWTKINQKIADKSFSVVRGVNEMPPSTLKEIYVKYFILFSHRSWKNIFFFISSDIVKMFFFWLL